MQMDSATERSTTGDYHVSSQHNWEPPVSLWLFGWLAPLLQCDWSLSSPASSACDSSHRPVLVPLLPNVWKQLLLGQNNTPLKKHKKRERLLSTSASSKVGNISLWAGISHVTPSNSSICLLLQCGWTKMERHYLWICFASAAGGPILI